MTSATLTSLAEYTPDELARIEARFWPKVDKTGDCWMWLSCHKGSAYGAFSLKSNGLWRMRLAHRVSYMLVVGPIPEGLDLDHLCRVPLCVNPAHLEPVRRRTNTLRGTAPSAVANQTGMCRRGHLFTPENTYVRPDGSRKWCRTCARMRDVARYARNAA